MRPVVLLFDVGLSYQEAGDTLDIPEGTVMSRLHRARKNSGTNSRGPGSPQEVHDEMASGTGVGGLAVIALVLRRDRQVDRLTRPLAERTLRRQRPPRTSRVADRGAAQPVPTGSMMWQ
jgi:hypothetical protein